MSNDTKFWLTRIGITIGLLINGSILTRFIQELWKNSDPKEHAHPALWFFFFLLSLVALVPLALRHFRAKAERFGQIAHKTQQQIEVEALSAYVSQQRADERKAVVQRPPTSQSPPKS